MDSGNNVYVAGTALSSDFPVTPGAFQTVNHGAANRYSNGFVTKLSSNGSSLLFSTYLGGSGNPNASSSGDLRNDNGDLLGGLAVDSSGNVYVSGLTQSDDFPVTPGAFQTVNKSRGSLFVSKLNPFGNSLVYSTYLGSSMAEIGASLMVDRAGNVYLSGSTLGRDFPVTPNAFQSTNNCVIDAFFTEVNSTGTNLLYSTYLGGSGIPFPEGNRYFCYNIGGGLASDGSGAVYLAGSATSPDFPTTTGAFETIKTADITIFAAFVTKFSFGTSATSSSVTTLNADVNPQYAGSPVNFTALVKSSSGGATPAGNVVFTVDGSNAATGALDSTGHATYSTSTLAAGNHTIGAVYSGDSTYSTSNGSFVETIIGTVTLSFNTLPSGLAYSVDGTTYTTSQSLSFAIASQHTISVTSPQTASGSLYAFNSWSDGGAQTHTITASANAAYTASFIPAGPSALFGNIVSKSGTTDARIWNVQITNGGPGIAFGAEVSNFAVTQTGGAACSPAVTSLLPAPAGDLAPGASVTVPVTLDFTGCATLARFTVTVSLSANSGSNNASIFRMNQFR